MKTHEVTDQAPERTGLDEYEANIALREGVEAFDAELARSEGADRHLDTHVRKTRALIRELARDDAREARARELVTALALALQGSLLVRTAPAPVTDAFIGSRLGGDGHLYGILPPGADAASIAARA